MPELNGYTRRELKDAQKYAMATGAVDRARTIAKELAKRKTPRRHTFVRRFVVLGALVPFVGLIEVIGGLQGAAIVVIGVIPTL